MAVSTSTAPTANNVRPGPGRPTAASAYTANTHAITAMSPGRTTRVWIQPNRKPAHRPYARVR